MTKCYGCGKYYYKGGTKYFFTVKHLKGMYINKCPKCSKIKREN